MAAPSQSLPLAPGQAERGSLEAQRGSLEARPLKIAVIGPNANRTLTLTSNYAGCKTQAGGPIMPSCTFVNPLQVSITP